VSSLVLGRKAAKAGLKIPKILACLSACFKSRKLTRQCVVRISGQFVERIIITAGAGAHTFSSMVGNSSHATMGEMRRMWQKLVTW
jgi:hypothetical protein